MRAGTCTELLTATRVGDLIRGDEGAHCGRLQDPHREGLVKGKLGLVLGVGFIADGQILTENQLEPPPALGDSCRFGLCVVWASIAFD